MKGEWYPPVAWTGGRNLAQYREQARTAGAALGVALAALERLRPEARDYPGDGGKELAVLGVFLAEKQRLADLLRVVRALEAGAEQGLGAKWCVRCARWEVAGGDLCAVCEAEFLGSGAAETGGAGQNAASSPSGGGAK